MAWLAQEVAGLGRKYIGYEYDLISGKVLRVNYQQGQDDQFYHRYAYDADNRITAVYTSSDGQLWDRDAAYQYYAHGPLKRMELGEDKVQGLDYTYTIQGWLKGINLPTLARGANLDGDGTGTSIAGRGDAFGMALGYYSGDYRRTGHGLSAEVLAADHQPAAGKDLYNGNIASWSSGHYYQVAGAGRQSLGAEQFTYDELNRITGSAYQNLGTDVALGANAFATSYSYDANGNLKTLTRNNYKGETMDNLTYNYAKDSQGGLLNNRLAYVQDGVPTTTATTEDVESQQADNYSYDAVGNLTQDVKSGISRISWSPYGKALKISKASGATISFGYDASGNRVSKSMNGETTYYVRDATGNVMGVYQLSGTELKLTEQPVYGSSRVGQRQPDLVLGAAPAAGGLYTRTLAQKVYELSDHLGNVRAVVSDRKEVAADGTFKPRVLNATSYYAFGQEMRSRFEAEAPDTYRYGYNGKEKDKDWGLTSYDYGFRIYSPAIGR